MDPSTTAIIHYFASLEIFMHLGCSTRGYKVTAYFFRMDKTLLEDFVFDHYL